MARDKPSVPADEVVTGDEASVLYKLLRHREGLKTLPAEVWILDIGAYVIDVARYAGFAPAKRQLFPGTKKLWQGYVKFKMAYIGFVAAGGMVC